MSGLADPIILPGELVRLFGAILPPAGDLCLLVTVTGDVVMVTPGDVVMVTPGDVVMATLRGTGVELLLPAAIFRTRTVPLLVKNESS